MQDESIAHLSEEVLSLKKEKDFSILSLEGEKEKLVSELQVLKTELEGNFNSLLPVKPGILK